MITKAEAQARVLRGVNLLAQADPEWFLVVSASELNLQSSAWCVLGQWAGSYLDGAMDLDLRDDTTACGFYADTEDVNVLEDVWREEITELKRVHRVKILAGGGSE